MSDIGLQPTVPAAMSTASPRNYPWALEETLLHTLEGVGPHTRTDLRHIEKLKRKHGIDYDSHASHRFVER